MVISSRYTGVMSALVTGRFGGTALMRGVVCRGFTSSTTAQTQADAHTPLPRQPLKRSRCLQSERLNFGESV